MNRNQILAASTIVAVTAIASIALFNDSPPPITEPAPIAQPAAPLVAPKPVESASTSTIATDDYYLGPEPKSVTQMRAEIAVAPAPEPEAPKSVKMQFAARLQPRAVVASDCPSEPLYYPPSEGACFNRDISGEPTGPSSCLKYRAGDTLWRVEFGGRVEFCVTPARATRDAAPTYVEFGAPYALMGGRRIDPHDPRTVREEHKSPRNRMMRYFNREWFASQGNPPVPDFNVAVLTTDFGSRHESLYVRCGPPMTWTSTDLRTGATKSGSSSPCVAEWVYLPSLMGGVRKLEPAKVSAP